MGDNSSLPQRESRFLPLKGLHPPSGTVAAHHTRERSTTVLVLRPGKRGPREFLRLAQGQRLGSRMWASAAAF